MLRKLQVLQTALQELQSRRLASLSLSERLSVRVARRWFQAGMDIVYDEFLRLQMLEGAAGVPVDTWWKKGPRAFKEAENQFEADSVDPQWFEKGNTGTYALLKRKTEAEIRSYGLDLNFGDIVNNALMGIPVKAHKPYRVKRPPYEAGKWRQVGIRDGKESPLRITAGPLQKWLRRKVSSEVKKFETQLLETEEGGTRDIADPSGSMGRGLLLDIFSDLHDPLGKDIRRFMRKTWKGTKSEEFMERWLDMFEDTGHFPKLAEVGRSLGKGISNFSKQFYRPAWRKFMQDLWRNHNLLNKLALKYEAAGIPWLQEMPTDDELEKAMKIPGGKRKHGSDPLINLFE